MNIVTKTLTETWKWFDLRDITAVYPDDDVIYIKGEACCLSDCVCYDCELILGKEANDETLAVA